MPISTLPATIECLQPIHNRREINVGGGFQKVVFPIKNDVLPAHGTHTFGLPLVARMLGLLLIEDISYFFLCCFTTSSPEILVGISSVFLFHFHLHLFFQLCVVLLFACCSFSDDFNRYKFLQSGLCLDLLITEMIKVLTACFLFLQNTDNFPKQA